jgi:dihydrodipicolinate synthase/N-acetylneuraminate lyase
MIKGLITPNLTFFTEGGDLDIAVCKWHMNWLFEKGVNGLFVTGTYGSGYLMSIEERIRIFSLAKAVCDDHENTFVIAHVGCADTASAIRLTEEANTIGINAVSAIGPLHYQYNDEEVVNFYKALAEVGDIPVFAYNNPDITGVKMKYDLVEKLEAVGIQGIKDSSIDLPLASSIYMNNKLYNKSFKYISGTTNGWPGLKNLEVDTMIAGMCNYVPELVVDLYNYSFTDYKKSLKIYEIIDGLGKKIKSGNSLVSAHLALKARGEEAGYMRLPLRVSYGDKNKLEQINRDIEEAIREVSSIKKST